MSEAPSADCLRRLDVLVLAGGLGTRLGNVLGDKPKLMAPIGGRPYLAYLLDWLTRFGARRVVLGLGHKAEAAIEFLRRRPMPDLEIVTLVEPQPLGTAGAIRFARGKLGTDPVLVMNGDSYCDADLCALVAHHRAEAAMGTLLAAEVDNSGRYGRLAVEKGRVVRFIEKDSGFTGAAPVSAGVYVLSARLLDAIAADTASSLERDVFAKLPPATLAVVSGRFRFIDIGTPESLARASEILRAAAAS